MILRRVIAHFRKQEWTAIFIDLVIVVLGVFFGLQVSNWNAARIERNTLEQQLAAFGIELEASRERVASYRAFAEGQIAAVNELRAAFAGDAAGAEAERIDALLFLVLRVQDLRLDLPVHGELTASGGLRRLSGSPLGEAIAKWESDLAAIERLDRDALIHRDDLVLPAFMEAASLAAVIENHPEQTLMGFRPSRFRNDVAALATSREIENILALRFAIEAQIVDRARKLEARADELIRALKTRERTR